MNIRRALRELTTPLRGGRTGAGQRYEPAGIVHRAEGVIPDGEGGLVHWRDTGSGYEYTQVDPAEYDTDER